MEATLALSHSLRPLERGGEYATATIVKKLDISPFTKPYAATLDFPIQIIDSGPTSRRREIETITNRSFFKLIQERERRSLNFVLACVKDEQGNYAMFDACGVKPWLETNGTNPKTFAKVTQVVLYTIGSLGGEFELLDQRNKYFIDIFIRANGGDSQAQYELGCYYEEGLHVKQDKRRAEHFFGLSAEAGNTKALLRKLPQMIRDREFHRIAEFIGEISLEDAIQVGTDYIDLFYAENIDLAKINFHALEAMGLEKRKCEIAYLKAKCLQRGLAVSRTGETIAGLFEFASQSCPKACYEKGLLALQEHEFYLAESYLIKAGKDHVPAQLLLAELYRSSAVPEFKKAFEILNRLNDQNVKGALVSLALLYLEGQGVPKNTSLAQSLLANASEGDVTIYLTLIQHLKPSLALARAPMNIKLPPSSERPEKPEYPYHKPETSPRNLEGSGDLGSTRKVNILLDDDFPDGLPPLMDRPEDSDDEDK